MKIGGLTIFLIGMTLASFIMFYGDNKILNMQEDLCEDLGDLFYDSSVELQQAYEVGASQEVQVLQNLGKTFEKTGDSYTECLYQQQHHRLKWGLMIVVTTIFACLTILSWKIDSLERIRK